MHWLVLPLVVLAYCVGGLYTLLAAYAVVFVHELFHLFAALISEYLLCLSVSATASLSEVCGLLQILCLSYHK